MARIPYLYSVVKYYEDPIKDEASNIGIVVVNSQENLMYSKIISNLALKIGLKNKKQDQALIRFFLKSIHENSTPLGEQEELAFAGSTNKEQFLEKISKTTRDNFSKLQVSPISVGVTEDLGEELGRLFALYVAEPKKSSHEQRFVTSVKKEFKDAKIIGRDRFAANKKIPGGRSGVEHFFDLSYQNGKLYIVDILDLRSISVKDACDSAFKYDDIIHEMGKRKVIPMTIVQSAKTQSASECMRILESYSKVHTYATKTKESIKNDFMSILAKA